MDFLSKLDYMAGIKRVKDTKPIRTYITNVMDDGLVRTDVFFKGQLTRTIMDKGDKSVVLSYAEDSTNMIIQDDSLPFPKLNVIPNVEMPEEISNSEIVNKQSITIEEFISALVE